MHNYFLKKFYFINSFKKNNIDKLGNNTGVIFRNYKNELNVNEIIKSKNYCKKKGIKFFLSNNIKLAIKLKLDGAYLPSFNNNFRHLSFNLISSFLLIGSAHNLKEIRTKEKQNVDLIFISSVFKKNKNYLGKYRFRILRKLTRNSVIALGGISKENISNLKLLNCEGFSGISFFE